MILPGNNQAISFNDDSSPARLTGSTKVCVNGQVDRAFSLDWYHRILTLFPDVPGELKSSIIVARFRNLPARTQAAIWLGLSLVRIHIVDPRPHYDRVNNLLRR